VPGIFLLLLALVGMLVSPLVAVFAFVAIGAVVLFLVPRDAVPAVALWLLVLVPVGYMDLPRTIGRYATPAVAIMAIWMIRVAFAQRTNLSPRLATRGWLIVVPFFGLLLASTFFSEVDTARSLAWIAVLSICVVTPALLGQTSLDDAWPTVRWTFAGIGLFLGVLAIVEYFFHWNPWTALFRSVVNEQAFSFVRTKTSLGHPLITSTVASVALVVCVFSSGKGRQWPYWICAAGALIAVILSVSRGGAIAVAFAVIIGMISFLSRTGQYGGRRRGRLISVLLAATFLASIAWSPLLSERIQTSGARRSADYRFTILENSVNIVADSPILGVGPGTSEVVYTGLYSWGIESSALQLIVSIGIPAFLFFSLGIGVVVGVAMRRSRAAVAAGIVAFFVAITGFNAVNSNPALLALATPLIFCAVVPSRHGDPGSGDRQVHRPRPPQPRQEHRRVR
jgi:O-antigen ligase